MANAEAIIAGDPTVRRGTNTDPARMGRIARRPQSSGATHPSPNGAAKIIPSANEVEI